MKKYFFIIIILITTVTGCERDDICIDDTTPNFIVRFYDNTDQTEFKNVNQLLIEYVGLDKDTLVSGTDSIAIPLDINSDMVNFKFIIDSNDETTAIEDSFTLNYIREEVFVGRSCGFKMIFNDLSITDKTSNWVQGYEIVNDTINNETAAHVKIFH